MLQEKSAGVIITSIKENKARYLLLHYDGGHWGFSKGNIEAKETEVQAAIREAEEETGLTNLTLIAGFKEIIEYYYRRNNTLVHKEVVYYLAQADQKDDNVTISHEHRGFKWLEYEEALQHLTFENNKRILEKAHYTSFQ